MTDRNEILPREIQADYIGDHHNRNNNNNNSNKRNNNNNPVIYNACSASVTREKSADTKNYHKNQLRRAPLIGWRDGSPTICSNSVRKSPDLDSVIFYSSSSSICQVDVDSTRNQESVVPLIEPINQNISNKIQQVLIREEYPTLDAGSNDSNSILKLDYLDSTKKKKCEKPKVPDGGWGWVVVVASLIISMVADGVSFSFGLLYIEFLHEFDTSKSKTAWIGSLFMAVPLLSGPIMSALVDRYGCRNMTIIGGLISGLGFIMSSFSNTIEVMYLTFGVIAGLGLGLCYVTAVVSIAYWFDKKRNLAVGLGACGTGIGTFLYAPMTTYFIEEYGWRGTCLLLAGTFFNLIISGTVMRDPEWWTLEQRKHNQATVKKSYVRSHGTKSGENLMNKFLSAEEPEELFRSDHMPKYLLQHLSTTTEEVSNNGEERTTFRSVVNLPTFIKRSEKVPLEVLMSLLRKSEFYTDILENYSSLPLRRSLSDKQLQDSMREIRNKSGITMSMRLKRETELKTITGQTKDFHLPFTHASTKAICTRRRMSRKELEEVDPLLAKEIAHMVALTGRMKSASKHDIGEFQGNIIKTDSLPCLKEGFNMNIHHIKDIKIHENSVMYRNAVLNPHRYRLKASSCPDIYRDNINTLTEGDEQRWYHELVYFLKGMLDFSMFLELHFLLLSLSTILLFTWFIVPYFYLAEHLIRNGYAESDAANLLSIIGISNTIGMIALGWAGDQPWMDVSKTYTWCLIACGTATIMMSMFTHHYAFLIISSAFFGLFFASNFSFTPVILVKLISLERFTTAYGLSLLCQGIGNLVGPPLAGWLFDVTGTWELSFLMAGSWIIFSGVLMGIIPYTKNRKIFSNGPVEIERTNSTDSLA